MLAVDHRIKLASKAFYAEPALMSRSLGLEARLRRYAEVVQPTLMFGCEAWTLTQSVMQKLRGAEGNFLRRVARLQGRTRHLGLRAALQTQTRLARFALTRFGLRLIEEAGDVSAQVMHVGWPDSANLMRETQGAGCQFGHGRLVFSRLMRKGDGERGEVGLVIEAPTSSQSRRDRS